MLSNDTIVREMLRLIGMPDGKLAQLVVAHDINRDLDACSFWCDGWSVEVGPFTTADRMKSLDDFGSAFIVPAAANWIARKGHERPKYEHIEYAKSWAEVTVARKRCVVI